MTTIFLTIGLPRETLWLIESMKHKMRPLSSKLCDYYNMTISLNKESALRLDEMCEYKYSCRVKYISTNILNFNIFLGLLWYENGYWIATPKAIDITKPNEIFYYIIPIELDFNIINSLMFTKCHPHLRIPPKKIDSAPDMIDSMIDNLIYTNK